MTKNLAALKAGLSAFTDTRSLGNLSTPSFKDTWALATKIPGSFSELNAAAMHMILTELQPATAVEIGSYLGRSTVFLADVLRRQGSSGRVYSIDPHTGDRQQLEAIGATTLPSFDLFTEHIRAMDLQNYVTALVATSDEASIHWDGPIDFLYIDGWHSYEAVLSDGRNWLPRLTHRGVVFIDDYNRYEDVHRAVHQLISEGTFRMYGEVFGQALGGTADSPTASVQRVVDVAGRRMSKRVHRLR